MAREAGCAVDIEELPDGEASKVARATRSRSSAGSRRCGSSEVTR